MVKPSLSKPGLRTRTVTMLGLLILLALVAMGATNYLYGSRLAIQKTLGVSKEKMSNDAQLIETRMVDKKADLIILREVPPVQGIIRARDNRGIDPAAGDKAEYWYDRMEQISAAFLKGNPEYLMLCYLDEQGNELTRVERNKDAITITPRAKLQNKRKQPYVTETIRLKENQAYYSDVTLDRDAAGQINHPYRPSLQLATPVYDGKMKVRGLIVMGLSARWLFSNIDAGMGMDDTIKYLIDQDGYFLAHPDWDKEFGRDLGFRYTIGNVHPMLVAELPATDSDLSQHRGFSHICGFQKIFFDPGNNKRFWAVVYEIPEATALRDVYKMQKTMLVVGLFIIVCSIGVIVWLSLREIISPLSRLIEAAGKMENGDLTVRLPEDKGADEFLVLHRTLNSFAEKQQNAIAHFEKELALRTSRLESSNRELQQFAYIASHDLQEPLRKISAFGDRLVTHSYEALDEKSRDYLARMQSAAGRMKQLIEDLLNYSRVTTQATPFAPVSLDELIKETLVMLDLRLAETGGQVTIEGELPAVHGDRSQLRQLFQNLLSNAVKYHQADLPPQVIISARELADGRAEITVTDNGIGFDEKYLDRIFLPFQRLHTRDEYEGTGIGLAISQKIVHRHGGTITARSRPGAGSSFTITLPTAGKPNRYLKQKESPP